MLKKQKNKKKKSLLVLAVLHYRVFGINSSQHFFHRLFQPKHYCSLPPQSVSSPHIQTCQFSQSWKLPKDGTSAKSFNIRVQRWKKKKCFNCFKKPALCNSLENKESIRYLIWLFGPKKLWEVTAASGCTVHRSSKGIKTIVGRRETRQRAGNYKVTLFKGWMVTVLEVIKIL